MPSRGTRLGRFLPRDLPRFSPEPFLGCMIVSRRTIILIRFLSSPGRRELPMNHPHCPSLLSRSLGVLLGLLLVGAAAGASRAYVNVQVNTNPNFPEAT